MRKREKRWTSAAAQRISQLAGNSRNIEQAVVLVAQNLLNGIQCPPTDLEMLKDRVHVEAVKSVRGLPIAGELRREGRVLRVVYSDSLSPGRRRFTIAHELGHAVFEGTGASSPRYGRELERICDMLATEFLMPRAVFTNHVGKRVAPEQIYQLARDFQTSVMATALRCQQLLGISIFQVENAQVAWGYGQVRRQQDLRADPDGFQAAIARAMKGDSGEQPVWLRGGGRLLRWVCSHGQRRALFVLEAMDKDQKRTEVHSSTFAW
jgi:IrrE N-terminal-like domain